MRGFIEKIRSWRSKILIQPEGEIWLYLKKGGEPREKTSPPSRYLKLLNYLYRFLKLLLSWNIFWNWQSLQYFLEVLALNSFVQLSIAQTLILIEVLTLFPFLTKILYSRSLVFSPPLFCFSWFINDSPIAIEKYVSMLVKIQAQPLHLPQEDIPPEGSVSVFFYMTWFW